MQLAEPILFGRVVAPLSRGEGVFRTIAPWAALCIFGRVGDVMGDVTVVQSFSRLKAETDAIRGSRRSRTYCALFEKYNTTNMLARTWLPSPTTSS